MKTRFGRWPLLFRVGRYCHDKIQIIDRLAASMLKKTRSHGHAAVAVLSPAKMAFTLLGL